MISVYHNSKFMARPASQWGSKCYPSPSILTLVAQVRTDDLDEAYRLTNSIDRYWWDNHQVSPEKVNTRSTSCGDILVDKKGLAYIVCAVGFERVKQLDGGPCCQCGDRLAVLGNDLCLDCTDEFRRAMEKND